MKAYYHPMAISLCKTTSIVYFLEKSVNQSTSSGKYMRSLDISTLFGKCTFNALM